MLRSLVGSILPGPSGVTKGLVLLSDPSPRTVSPLHLITLFASPSRSPMLFLPTFISSLTTRAFSLSGVSSTPRPRGFFTNELGWRVLAGATEERINPTEADPEKHGKDLRKKLRRTERSSIKRTDVEGPIEPEVKKEIDERVEDWERGRASRFA